MRTRAAAKTLYSLFGAGYLLVGLLVLLYGTGRLPEAASGAVLRAVKGDMNALHIVQEFGAVLVFVGLITFWFVRHYEQSRAFHWAMTAAWGLIALAHWFDVRGEHSAVGPFINTVPFALLLLLGLLRMKAESRRQ